MTQKLSDLTYTLCLCVFLSLSILYVCAIFCFLDFIVLIRIQIDISDRARDDVFSIILDGTECPINRPGTHLQQSYYTGKSKWHVIKYEVGVHPHTGRLVWVGGPVPGCVHDLTLTRMHGLLEVLEDDELILADKGYVGEFKIITPFKGRQLD